MAKDQFSDMAQAPLFGTVMMIVGSLALLAASEPVLAGEPSARTVMVSMYGADLATPRGRNEMHSRIDRAARQVCVGERLQRFRSYAAERRCIETAIARARVQVAAIMAARPVMADVAPLSPSATSPEEQSVL